MKGRSVFYLSLTLMGILSLMACAPSPQVEIGWLKDGKSQFIPDSMKAIGELQFKINPPGQKEEDGSLNAYFFVVPYQRYRVELKGPLNIHIASILWDQGNWQAWLPQENLHIIGKGSEIQLPIPGLSDVKIHNLISSLWGEVLPKGWETAAFTTETTPKNTHLHLNWDSLGTQYYARINETDQQVKELKYLNQHYKYYDWSRQDSLYFPATTKIQLGNTQLEIKIEEVDLNATWSERLWNLRVPPKAKRREVF